VSTAAEATRRRRRLRVGQCLLLLFAVVLALPASAQATWTAPVDISGPGQDASAPQVAVDPNGNAVFVWQRPDGTDCSPFPGVPCYRVQARVRSATGVLSPVQTLSAPGQPATEPQVAVDPNGNAVFVWQRYDGTTDCGGYPCLRIEARARSSSGVLSPVQALSSSESTDPELAIDGSGNTVFVWEYFDRTATCRNAALGEHVGCFRIQTRVRSAAGALSAIQNLHPEVGINGGSPEVAVDASGNAVFVWLNEAFMEGCGDDNESPCVWIQTRVRSAGSLSPIQGLSYYGGRHSAGDASVAVDPNGNAVFAWSIVDWNNYECYFPCVRVQARARSADGTLSGTPFLSAAGADGAGAELGVDQSGNAVFVWALFDYTCNCGHIEARVRSATGALSATQTLSGVKAGAPDIAVDPDGNAVVVWAKSGGGAGCGGSGCNRIEARARSAAGALSSAQFLSAPGQHADSPHVAVTPTGNAVGVWRRFNGTNWVVQAATGP
jgi:hypothetical protein